MSGMLNWLEDIASKDTRVRAVLRRSLAFEPGTHAPAFPYVEPFVGTGSASRRSAMYLVAGVWALHWREGSNGVRISIARASAMHLAASGSASMERRFINLLDADEEQLAHRLRQMMTLLKDYPIDCESLLSGLIHWTDAKKRTQNSWAREFYRTASADVADETITPETVA